MHRIGRTARLGAEGDAISFACDLYAVGLPDIEAYIEQKIPTARVEPEMLVIPPPRVREKIAMSDEDVESNAADDLRNTAGAPPKEHKPHQSSRGSSSSSSSPGSRAGGRGPHRHRHRVRGRAVGDHGGNQLRQSGLKPRQRSLLHRYRFLQWQPQETPPPSIQPRSAAVVVGVVAIVARMASNNRYRRIPLIPTVRPRAAKANASRVANALHAPTTRAASLRRKRMLRQSRTRSRASSTAWRAFSDDTDCLAILPNERTLLIALLRAMPS